MCKMVCSRKGLTLLEVIIVLAIMSIVAAIAWSLNAFAQKSVITGGRQSSSQFDVRMIADFITNEVRYANNVNISDGITGGFENTKKYLYVDEDGHIKYNVAGVDTPIPGAGNSRDITLTFTRSADKRTLKFRIHTVKDGQEFDISSEALILNLIPEGITSTGGDTGTAITFGPLSDSESVEFDSSWLDLATINDCDLNAVTENLFLPESGANGTVITWQSNNPAISDRGVVVRPSSSSADALVQLTAKITKGAEYEYKTFNVIVIKRTPLVLNDAILPQAERNNDYVGYQFTVSGGGDNPTFSVVSISGEGLPAGYVLSPDGYLSGNSSVAGTYYFTVKVTDELGGEDTRTFSLVIA